MHPGSRRGIVIFSTLALFLLTSFLLRPVPAASQEASLWTTFIAPNAVDPDASTTMPDHYVAFDASVPRRSELVLYLGGFLATPADATLIVDQAARSGYHAIGLSFPKPAQLSNVCQSDPDEMCFESGGRAVIYGGDGLPFSVSAADSVVNQVTRLLRYLEMQRPGQGWADYVEDGQPRWSAIRLASHSTGGSHATLIAQEHSVARLCLMEAPVDVIGAPGGLRRLAPWVQTGGATPADRIFAFEHRHTTSQVIPGFEGAWGLFGLDRFGQTIDVDSSTPPYGGSHHLTTDERPAVDDDTPNPVHRSLVEDRLTPKNASGEPLFAPVWQYECFD